MTLWHQTHALVERTIFWSLSVSILYSGKLFLYIDIDFKVWSGIKNSVRYRVSNIFEERVGHRPNVLLFNAERVSLSRVIVLNPHPIPMPAGNGYSLQRGRGGSLDCIWGVQMHNGPLACLVPFWTDLARINSTRPCWESNPSLTISSLNP